MRAVLSLCTILGAGRKVRATQSIAPPNWRGSPAFGGRKQIVPQKITTLPFPSPLLEEIERGLGKGENVG